MSNYEEKDPDDGVARAVLYNLFADAMARKLDKSWLNPHFQSNLSVGVPEIPARDEMLAALTEASGNAGYYQALQLDYDALFIVPGPSLIFPYESCYTHRNIDGSFGRLWQEPAQDMQHILNEWEIKFAEGWDLIPDHIAVELFFMANLCRLAGAADVQEEDRQRLQEWQKRFFETHLANWVFELLDTMEHKAKTGFYRGMAKLLRSFLLEEQEAFAVMD